MTPDASTGSTLNVGVVGLGQMGAGIARNLEKAGLLHAVFDIDETAIKRAGLGPKTRLLSPLEMIQECDVSLYAVAQTAQIAAHLYETPPAAGSIVMDVTTSDPSQAICLAKLLSEQGIEFIDAPVAGGATGADDGALTLLVGGEGAVIARCQPVFDAISKRVFSLGPVGSGHGMKLIHNMILHSAFLATCEGLRVAEHAGMNIERTLEVLNASNARSFVTETRFPRDIVSGKMNTRCAMSHLEKDLSLALRFGRDNDAKQPFTALTLDMLRTATSRTNPTTDFSWLFPMFDELAESLSKETA